MRNDLLKVTYLINATAWAIDTAPSCILSTVAHMNPLNSFPKGSRMWCFLNSHSYLSLIPASDTKVHTSTHTSPGTHRQRNKIPNTSKWMFALSQGS